MNKKIALRSLNRQRAKRNSKQIIL